MTEFLDDAAMRGFPTQDFAGRRPYPWMPDAAGGGPPPGSLGATRRRALGRGDGS